MRGGDETLGFACDGLCDLTADAARASGNYVIVEPACYCLFYELWEIQRYPLNQIASAGRW